MNEKKERKKERERKKGRTGEREGRRKEGIPLTLSRSSYHLIFLLTFTANTPKRNLY